MKYDFSKVLVGMTPDSPLKTDGGADLTARAALRMALLQDTQANASTKLQRYDMFVKLQTVTPDLDLTIEEVKILKDAAMELSTLAAGQLVHILNKT